MSEGPRVLSDEQRALLTAILNRIVPASGKLQGAGDLGCAEAVELALAGSTASRRLLLDGLAEIQLASYRRAGRSFGELADDDRDTVLREVELAQPAFFTLLVEQAYRVYYQLPVVHAAIGWNSRPPQPLGHELPMFDPDLLEQQRRRAPFWRPVD